MTVHEIRGRGRDGHAKRAGAGGWTVRPEAPEESGWLRFRFRSQLGSLYVAVAAVLAYFATMRLTRGMAASVCFLAMGRSLS